MRDIRGAEDGRRRLTPHAKGGKDRLMPAQENKELVHRFYEEVWDRGNLDVCDEVFAPEYVRHDFRSTEPVPGPEGQKQIAADFRAAFPDLDFVVDFLVAEDDFVVGRWTATGTHSGRWGTGEPTGRFRHDLPRWNRAGTP